MWIMLNLGMTLEIIAAYALLVKLFCLLYLPFWRMQF